MRLFIIALICITSVACSANQKEVKEASNAICDCFRGFSNDDANEMNQTIACLDSIKEILPIESIPKNKLEKELDKSCAQSKDHMSLLFD